MTKTCVSPREESAAVIVPLDGSNAETKTLLTAQCELELGFRLQAAVVPIYMGPQASLLVAAAGFSTRWS